MPPTVLIVDDDRTVVEVLLDCTMPGPDGFEVCRLVREESDPGLRAIPVVMLTALGEAEDTARGFAAGATDYLTKPFKTTHVRTRVLTWLARAVPGPDSTEQPRGKSVS